MWEIRTVRIFLYFLKLVCMYAICKKTIIFYFNCLYVVWSLGPLLGQRRRAHRGGAYLAKGDDY